MHALFVNNHRKLCNETLRHLWETVIFLQTHPVRWCKALSAYRALAPTLFFNPLTPELPQHGVPKHKAPRHNIIFNSSFFEIFKPIFRLYVNKSKTCRSVFWPNGNL